MSAARRLSTCTLALLLSLFALSIAQGSTARANLEFDEVKFDIANSDGTFARQAGSHPDFRTIFSVPFDPDAEIAGQPSPGPTEALHTVEVDLPPGMVGNLVGIPTCSPAEVASPGVGISQCPIGSQVGVARVVTTQYPMIRGVFNVAHGPEVAARLGMNLSNATVFIDARVRPREYGVSSGTAAVSQGATFQRVNLTLWGVPADSSHDNLRSPVGGFVAADPADDDSVQPFSVPSPAPRVAFLSLPTSCEDNPSSFAIRGDSWEHPGIFDVQSLSVDSEGTPFVFDGCEKLPFSPSASVQPRSRSVESPTGLDLDLDIPQSNGPDELVTAHVRRVKMTFPEGMTVNPSSATGLGSCSEAQIGLDTVEAPRCPGSSKLGTVLIDTPVLSEQLQGSIYLARQHENPFDSLLALYISVKGPGFYLKLPGKAELDPGTGQLTTLFDETPQLPFSKMQVQLKDGPRSALSTPRKCGTYTIRTEFRSWAQPEIPVYSDSSFKVDENCDSGGFTPKLRAGTTDATAGSSSPFLLQVTRADGEQNLSRIEATLPEGLLAKLAGVPLCGDAQAATGECPAATQVGKVMVGTGAGPLPVYVPEAGKAPTAAYLAGPYKGAPYSLVVKVPAQAGPFDLGTVAVRNGLYIDPTTTQVTAKSDPLPQILQGIPIAYRDVRVEVNRPDFTVNPTSCKAQQVTSVLTSATGQTAMPSAPFSASDCSELGFKPKLAIRFSGKTHRTAHPALKATLTMPKAGANIGKAVVLLPQTEFIDNAHITTPCTRVQFHAGACPKNSILGRATAYTPLLDQPLSGPVYFRSNGGERELPDLVADLNGAIHVTLVGFIDSVKTGPETARVRTRFLGVPDAPISKFVLDMKGGGKGLIVNNTELCRAKPRAKVQLTGQNGKRSVTNPLIKVGCGKSSKKRK